MVARISEASFTSPYRLTLTRPSTLVRAQMLSELEEIIMYKQYADQPERQQAMRKTWMKRCESRCLLETVSSSAIRLQGCQPDVETWQRILQVRALVLNPEDDPVMWIKFANLCRKSDRMALAEKTINSLLSPERVSCSFGRYLTQYNY